MSPRDLSSACLQFTALRRFQTFQKWLRQRFHKRRVLWSRSINRESLSSALLRLKNILQTKHQNLSNFWRKNWKFNRNLTMIFSFRNMYDFDQVSDRPPEGLPGMFPGDQSSPSNHQFNQSEANQIYIALIAKKSTFHINFVMKTFKLSVFRNFFA